MSSQCSRKDADMPETSEEMIRKHIIELSESAMSSPVPTPGISVQDFTPYLLLKMLERLESIEETLDILNGSITDFWNSKYNS